MRRSAGVILEAQEIEVILECDPGHFEQVRRYTVYGMILCIGIPELCLLPTMLHRLARLECVFSLFPRPLGGEIEPGGASSDSTTPYRT